MWDTDEGDDDYASGCPMNHVANTVLSSPSFVCSLFSVCPVFLLRESAKSRLQRCDGDPPLPHATPVAEEAGVAAQKRGGAEDGGGGGLERQQI